MSKPKRKMPKKLVTLDLSGSGYEGFEVDAWINTSVAWSRHYVEVLARAMAKDAKPADERELADAFLELFPAWRGFVDWEGNKIPHTRVGINGIPIDLSEAMWAQRAEAMKNGAMAQENS